MSRGRGALHFCDLANFDGAVEIEDGAIFGDLDGLLKIVGLDGDIAAGDLSGFFVGAIHKFSCASF